MIAKRLVVIAAVAASWLTFAATPPASAEGSGSAEPDPVMESEDPEVTGIATPPPASAQASSAEARAAATGYSFSAQGLADVQSAATAFPRPTGCSLSSNGLAALMLSPTFPETGAGSAATPSPMTLSRWDRDIGLYSMSDKSTYVRAFWHPGIGMWQFDGAGFWGLTAYERMNTTTAAPLAATVMGGRYCNAKKAGLSDASARASAWGPWVACRSGACQQIFDSIYQGTSSALDVQSDSSVGRAGGVSTSTCAPPGLSSRSCNHVDPGDAQGYLGWTGTPSGSTSVAPLSYPFDVVKVGSDEWRLWDRADTGYGVDIAAKKPLTANPRSKTNPDRPCERISPVTWYVNGSVVDSVDRSACADLYPPSGLSQTSTKVSGTYQVVAGDFSGDGLDDIVWYAPGGAADFLWRSPVTSYTDVSISISGTYEPLVGDFDGDGRDDIFWYKPGSGADYVWTGKTNSPASAPFTNHSVTVNGSYDPVVGDFDRDGTDDIFWLSPSSTRHYLWTGATGLAFDSTPVTLAIDGIDGVGDFDGDGRTDLVDHRPGAAEDAFFFATGSGFVRRAASVGGTYDLEVGDFDDNGVDDIYWYSVGAGSDYVWFNDPGIPSPGTQPAGAPANLASGKTAAVLDSANGSDVVWARPGTGGDEFWTFSGRSLTRSTNLSVLEDYRMIVGRWTAGGDGVLFYAPGSTPDAFWTR
ncbi:FG-GAP repeat protein [Actinospongicola halichondriae]|uniref:FG-GAP repeat protein n=1 Tax=Actinospongicola halichondriae TaxID=3236844 RepID=UPI003D46ED91